MSSIRTQLFSRRPQPWQARYHRSQRGVALIEALVSVLIFSFGVIGLMGLEASAISFSRDAEDRTRAAVLANEITSSMWLANSVTVSAAQLTAWQTKAADAANGGLPNGSVTITPVAGTGRRTDISITWKPPTDATSGANHKFTTRVILP